MQFVDLKGKMYPISEYNRSEKIIKPVHILSGSVLLCMNKLDVFVFSITDGIFSSDLWVNVEPGSIRIVSDTFRLHQFGFTRVPITDCYYPTRRYLDAYLEQTFGI